MIDRKNKYLGLIALSVTIFGILILDVQGWAFQGSQTADLNGPPSSSATNSTIPASSENLVADLDKGCTQASEAGKIVEAIVNRQPIDDRLFLIGPRPTSENAGEPGAPAEELSAADSESRPDLDASTAARAQDTVLEDNWVQMDLDNDGTYLFVGEGAEDDEVLNDSEMLDLDDIGVGIGKKWHF